MPHNQFLLVVTLLLAIGAATVLLFRRAGFGSVLALLATGLVLGPHGLELVADGETTLRGFTEFGVVLLLFLIGLETQPARLWRMRRHVFGLGTAQVLVTGTTLALLARWLAGASPLGRAGARLWSRLVVDGFRSSASAGELGAADSARSSCVFSPPVAGSGGGTAARIDATAG